MTNRLIGSTVPLDVAPVVAEKVLLGFFAGLGSRVFVISPVTPDRVWKKSFASYDGASVSPDFANGAVSGAIQAAMMGGGSRDSVTVTGDGSDVEAAANPAGPDVVGSPEMDAAMVRHYSGMPSNEYREQGFGYLPGDKFTKNYWISEDGGSFSVPTNATGIGHTHVVGGWQVTIRREWPGPGDHLVVEGEGGRPNYFRTPSRAIRVVERVDGQFRLRTVTGTPYLDTQWAPGKQIDFTSRMRQCQCFP